MLYSLGVGGNAIVYAVRHATLGTEHALKVLVGSGPGTRDRLLREAHAQRSLSSENIVPVTDILEVNGAPALLMPLIDGCSLHEALRVGVQAREVPPLFAGVAAGVAAAHAAGFAHRDLKPHNVLLERGPEYLVPKVTDFGLVKIADAPPVTGPGFVGTLGYAAPEQLEDTSGAGTPADIWSLGALLHRLLVGRLPFQGRTMSEQLASIRASAWDPLAVEERWRALVRAMLAPDPRARPTAQEVAAEFEGVDLSPIRRVSRLGRVVDATVDATRRDTEPSTEASPAESRWPRHVEARPFGRRLKVISAHEDDLAVRREVQSLRVLGYAIDYRPVDDTLEPVRDPGLTDPGPPPELVDELMDVDEVLVFWSAAARRSPRVGAEVACAIDVGERRGKRPFIGAKALDRTPMPAELAAGTESPHPITWLCLATAGIVTAVVFSDPHASFPQRVASLAAVGAAMTVALLQWTRSGDRILRAARVHAFGRWLARAHIGAVLQLADDVLNGIFGARLVSLRAVATSGAISAGSILFTAAAWGVWDVLHDRAAGGTWGHAFGLGLQSALGSARWGGPMLAVGTVAGFVSLVFTRRVLRRLVAMPTPGRLVLGLSVDAAFAVACALVSVASNIGGTERYTVWGWIEFVFYSGVWVATGELRLRWLLGDPLLLVTVACWVAALLSALPSFVHGSLLGVWLLDRGAAGVPLRLVGAVMRRAADSPGGPWTLALPLLVGALGFAAWPVAQAPSADPAALARSSWRLIDTSVCGPPDDCLIGCPDQEPTCYPSQRIRRVSRPEPFELLRTEMWQELWIAVWDSAERVVPDRFGLEDRRDPFRYSGARLPAEPVTWCEALRFANLWTAVEAHRSRRADLRPMYRSVVDGGYDLKGCEASGVDLAADGQGYRLPSTVEWEIAARGGTKTAWWTGDDPADALAVDWVDVNARWHPHPVDAPPDPVRASRHPFGLLGMIGNAQEWTYDPWTLDAGVLIMGHAIVGPQRVCRSSSWLDTIEGGRSSAHGPVVQNHAFGSFRLVRTFEPSP